jgi:hypothetical protein
MSARTLEKSEKEADRARAPIFYDKAAGAMQCMNFLNKIYGDGTQFKREDIEGEV